MVESWLALLLRRPPPSIARQTESAIDPRDGATLALRDVTEYQHIRQSRPQTELPAHDEKPSPGDHDRTLLVALLNLLLSHPQEAADMCRRVAATADDGDAVAAAGVLASVALSETNDAESALEILGSTIDRLPEGAISERAVLLVHRSARLADVGRWDEGLAAASEAAALEPADELREVVRRAGRANAVVLRGRATGTWLYDDSPVDPLPPTLRWRLEHIVAAGDGVLEANFRDVLLNPFASEWHHVRRSTDRQLWSIVFHAQCRADIGQAKAALASLGRHRVVAAVVAGSAPDLDTYKALLDAGDAELDRVVRRFTHHGPVEGLVEFARMAAARPWERVDSKSTLEALGILGQLFDVTTADELVTRLVAFVDEDRAWNLREPGARALAATLSAASNSAHAACSKHLLGWFDEENTDRWTDVLARAIRWPDVPRGIQRSARSLVERWADGEAPGSAAALLLPLSRGRGSRWGHTQAMRAFELRPSLQNGAYVLDVGTPSSAPVLERVRALATEAVAAETADAAKGHYGFGGINAALVLVVALLRIGRPDPEGWSAVAAYIADRKTLARTKEDVVDALSRSVDDLDPAAIEVIRGAVRAGVTGEEFLGGESTRELDAAVAGLSMALRVITPADALDHLRRHVGSTSVADRIAAARMLSLARSVLRAGQVVELSMVLLWDGDPDVRAAAAGSAIDLLRRTRLSYVAEELSERLISQLREEGTTAPLAVLRRLSTLPRAKRAPFVDAVLHARERAASAIVRGAGGYVAERWRLTDGLGV